jgi:hypothetical protein
VFAGLEVRPGTHRWVWDGLDDGGRRVPPGIYFCRLTGKGVSRTVRTAVVD